MIFVWEFLNLDLGEYKNLGPTFPIGIAVTIAALALILALFVINYHKLITTRIIKSLKRHEAFGEAKAKTLKELRIDTSSVRRALSGSGKLNFIVKAAGEEKMSYDEYVEESKKKGFKEKKRDFAEARFYIPKERELDAMKVLDAPTDGWVMPIIFTAVIIVLWVLIAIFAPDLLTLLSKAFEK